MLKLRQTWQNLRGSLWFLPGILVLTGVGAALALIELDEYFEPQVFDDWPRLFGSGAEGSRGLLSTVASSMITVAGVVFSITIVALSQTSTQYTSRVLRNFMGDHINQSVLGVFVGIFAYCLVVLRTVRGGDEGPFVPSLAVLFALILAFVGIGVLIYFIHHISMSIQAANILAAVSSEAIRAINHLFPEGVGDEEQVPDPPLPPGWKWHPVPAKRTGYVQSLDTNGLLNFATDRNLVIRMERAVGQFVIEGAPLVAVLAEEALPEDDEHRLAGYYAIDRQRTVEQDAGYGIRQIVDIALKALSPGVNDTTTAVMCTDYLTAILLRLTARRIESQFRSEEGDLRLITRGPTYASLVAEALDEIRQNAGGNVTILRELLGSIGLLATRTSSPLRLQILLEHAQALVEVAQRTVEAPRDRAHLEERARATFGALGQPAAFQASAE